MFTLSDKAPAHHCQGYSRRDFLRVGSLGLGGLGLSSLTLADLFAARAQAGSASGGSGGAGLKHYIKDKSVVLLFLHGGPSQLETWDPKPDASTDIRTMFGTVKTKLPGVQFGSHFPRMAKLADKLAIVRSFQSRNGGHTYESVAVANNPLKAAMSAVYARIAGCNHPTTGMPLSTLLLPEAVQAGIALGSNFETSALGSVTQPGMLGPNYEAFNVAGYVSKGDGSKREGEKKSRSSSGSPVRDNMELRIEPDRLADRRHLLSQLDRMRRDAERSHALDTMTQYQQQAFEVITKGVGDAFDLSKEDPRTIDRYDTSKLFRLDEVTRWFDMKRASNMLGHQMLLARRMCEAGCGFVTVSDCGWDMHSNSNSPKNLGAMHMLGPQVDHAVAAFLEDVAARGLSEKILLVITGEMGRTPRINGNGGREHHANLTPLILAGGGLRMGQVVGESDRNAERPHTDPYGPEHLASTIYHTLFDLGQLRLDSSVPRDVANVVQGGSPIKELM